MEVIKRKISLDNYISRKQGSWGQLTATTFNVNIFIKQNMDDMGIGTDVAFLSDPNINPILDPNRPNIRYSHSEASYYYKPGLFITGFTEDRLRLVRSYSLTNPYQPGLNIRKNDNTTNFENNPYISVDKVISDEDQMPISYILDGDESESIDLNNPQNETGILFKTYSGNTRSINDSVRGNINIPVTEMYYEGQGFNATNTTLSATTKHEYLFGITTTPTVFSDIFVDRGRSSAFQSHLQLSEIKNMSDLVNYGNGYYNVNKIS